VAEVRGYRYDQVCGDNYAYDQVLQDSFDWVPQVGRAGGPQRGEAVRRRGWQLGCACDVPAHVTVTSLDEFNGMLGIYDSPHPRPRHG